MMKDGNKPAFTKTPTFRRAPTLTKSPTLTHQYSRDIVLQTTSATARKGATPQQPQQQQHVPRKHPVIEFPTSPDRKVGEEMLHFSHPQHPLSHISLDELFTCEGCKEHGAARRYACQICKYQLHEFCALAPQALNGHPLHYQHQLVFYSKPVKSGIGKPKCDACAKSIKGYSFRCNPCNFQIHPCCAMLPLELFFSAHPHTLRLQHTTASSGGDTGPVCGQCKTRRAGGRMYRCRVCDYQLHAACAKVIFNGLHDSGFNDIPGKSGTSGTSTTVLVTAATRFASQFIGGLLEGIGQGVGQDILQDVGNAFVSKGGGGK